MLLTSRVGSEAVASAEARCVCVALCGSHDLDYLAGHETPPRRLIRVAFGEPFKVNGSESVDELLERTRKEIIRLNVSIGGRGAAPGMEDQHVAGKGNPTKRSQFSLGAWLKP